MSIVTQKCKRGLSNLSFHIIKEKARWYLKKRKLKFCGYGTYMKEDFNILSPENISLGNNTHFGKGCQICVFNEYQGKKNSFFQSFISIGNNVTVTDGCYISCVNRIEIGDGCLLGVNTFITDNYHGKNTYEELLIPPNLRELYSKGPVIIGKNVWTGRNVCIMPGINIGDNVIIGANAVVTHDIPSNCIVAGVPAKIIRKIEKHNGKNGEELLCKKKA